MILLRTNAQVDGVAGFRQKPRAGIRQAAVWAVVAAIGTHAVAQRAAVKSGAVLNGVSIVDTRTGKVQAGMAIAVDGGKITRIGRAGTIRAQGSARMIDAKGKFVVPGYWEMHAHPIDSPDRVNSLTLMLANGITGVRQMSGSDALLQQRKAGTLMPANDSPELLAMPGSILLRGNSPTVPAAIAEVDKQKAEGADFIKTIDVSVPVFFAALDEATKQGLAYDGHLSTGVDALKASEAGMRGIEHLGPQETMLISCSTDEGAMRDAIAKRLQAMAAAPPPVAAPSALTKAATSNPTLSRALQDPASFAKLQHVVDTYSEEKCRKAAAVFVAHHTWQIPTLIRLRTAQFGDDPVYINDPNLVYVAAATRDLWSGIATQFTAKISLANKETLKQFYALQLKVAKLFDDAGVKMLAGSDFGGMWLVAGFSLHQEFDQLQAAGFKPLRVLQMTTLDAAEFLNRSATDGTVDVGKNANLVLLDGDPTQSIANLHKVAGLVRAGQYYSADQLEALKKHVASNMDTPRARSLPAQTDDDNGDM